MPSSNHRSPHVLYCTITQSQSDSLSLISRCPKNLRPRREYSSKTHKRSNTPQRTRLLSPKPTRLFWDILNRTKPSFPTPLSPRQGKPTLKRPRPLQSLPIKGIDPRSFSAVAPSTRGNSPTRDEKAPGRRLGDFRPYKTSARPR